LRDFVPWQKVTGGKWWGYEEPIGPGEYSDDTQLALAIARCITETGTFEPERFAYQELPLWLQYERGGGKSVKTAARTLIGKNADWLRNFYKQAAFDYRSAGTNGAAMRTLPIALVNSSDERQMIRDSFLHAIITHGHPRAIIGAILFSLAVRYALTTSSNPAVEPCIEYLRNGIERVEPIMRCDDLLARWMHNWEKQNGSKETSFRHLFNETCQEAFHHLEGMPQLMHEEQRTYYTLVGALTSATRSSGLATVCVAIFLFLKYCDHPEEALTAAVNAFGSDTDTIAVFLEALLGACHGLKAVPAHLFGRVQDQEYLLEIAKRLHTIAAREERAPLLAQDRRLQREDAYLNILS
jgi:ADP-ribosylglycohydrolase